MDSNIEKKKAGRPATKKVETNDKKSDSENIKVTKTSLVPQNKDKVKIPLDTDISCKSAVRGELRYLSKRQNGYQVVWNEFGDENSIEFQELVSMRNTDLRFFKDNWIVIEDSNNYTAQEIMDALRVRQYYNVKLDVDNFDSLFNESPDKIKEQVSKMSSGLKDTVGIRAKQLYNDGKLDSLNRIKVLEESLGITLIVK